MLNLKKRKKIFPYHNPIHLSMPIPINDGHGIYFNSGLLSFTEIYVVVYKNESKQVNKNPAILKIDILLSNEPCYGFQLEFKSGTPGNNIGIM